MLNPFEDIVSWSIKNSKAGNWLILCWSNVDRTKIKTWNSKSGNRHIFRRCLQWPMMLQQQLQIPQRQWFEECRTSLFLKNEQVSRRKCLWIMWFTSYYPYWWNAVGDIVCQTLHPDFSKAASSLNHVPTFCIVLTSRSSFADGWRSAPRFVLLTPSCRRLWLVGRLTRQMVPLLNRQVGVQQCN